MDDIVIKISTVDEHLPPIVKIDSKIYHILD